jgi:23S rRNA pseudouridine1911/1915/1917 synthase
MHPETPPDKTTDRPRVRMIAPHELDSWIFHDDEQVLAVNKPGDVVCHPSKAGPWSSLAGAVREHLRLAAAHLVFRLDRETSGVVVFAKNPAVADRLQKSLRLRQAGKTYLAVMTGEFSAPATVDQPLGPDEASPVAAKSAVPSPATLALWAERGAPRAQSAVTHFTPLACGGGFTLARVSTETGRKHQIRAHAQWLGRPLVGDKIYGPDERLFLDFISGGWTPALEEKLLLPRQALHCAEIDMRKAGLDRPFSVPMPPDMRAFCEQRGLPVPEGL